MKITSNKVMLIGMMVFYFFFVIEPAIPKTKLASTKPENQIESLLNPDIVNDGDPVLQGILVSIKHLMMDLTVKKKERKRAKSVEDKAIINDEIKEIKNKITDLKGDFEKIATGVDIEALDTKTQNTYKLKEELIDFLGPILMELKQLTARPRRMERIRNEITLYNQKDVLVKKTIFELERLIKFAEQKDVRTSLEKLKKKWAARSQQISNRLIILKHQLKKAKTNNVSIAESTQNFLRSFFKSRGKNLFISLLAFLVVFLFFRIIHRLLHKFSAFYRKKKKLFTYG